MKETKQYLREQVARAQLPWKQEADCVDTAVFGTPIFGNRDKKTHKTTIIASSIEGQRRHLRA